MSSRPSHRNSSRSRDWESFSDDNLRVAPRAKGRADSYEPPRTPVQTMDRADHVPPRAAVPSLVADRLSVYAIVKWFNTEKGFGFGADEQGRGLFIHSSVLRSLGLSELETGAKILVDIVQSDKGDKVSAIHSVEAASAIVSVAAAPIVERRPQEVRSTPYAAKPLTRVTGVVKWYNAEKGFGFMSPSDGGRDIFIHASALERSGVAALAEGAEVDVDVVVGRSGKTEVGLLRLS